MSSTLIFALFAALLLVLVALLTTVTIFLTNTTDRARRDARAARRLVERQRWDGLSESEQAALLEELDRSRRQDELTRALYDGGGW